MPIVQLDTENADRNLTSEVTCLTHTVPVNAVCYGLICLGDGSKDLDGDGGNFEVEVSVGGQVVQEDPLTFTVPASQGRIALPIPEFACPASSQVIFKVKSPDASDTDVDCTAYLLADLDLSYYGVVVGEAASGTLSTTQMTTDLTEATNDHYNGRVVVWTSGDLAGQAATITDYDGATKKLTYTTRTEAPSDGDRFVIV